MPGLWKAWKAKSRLPTLSTSPLEISPQTGEIPTFPQLRRLFSLPTKPPAGGLSPPVRAPLRAASVVPFSSAAVVYFYSALDTLGAHGAAIIATVVLGALIGRYLGNRRLHVGGRRS